MRNMAMINYSQRFAVELKTLIMIERECLYFIDYIKKEIEEFFKDNPKLNDILQFVDTVYTLGYHLADFSFNILKRTEVEDLPYGISQEEREKLRNASMWPIFDDARALMGKYDQYKKNKH